MIKKILSFSFLAFSFSLVSAQVSESDSLWNVIVHGKEDTNKLDALTYYGGDMSQVGHYKMADSILQEAIKLATKLGGKKLSIEPNIQAGNSYCYQSNYVKANEYYAIALELSKETGNKRGESDVYYDLANLYSIEGDYGKTLDYNFKALKINEELGDKLRQSRNLNSIGSTYQSLKELDKALEYLQKALILKKEIGKPRPIANTLSNIGLIYWSKGDYANSMQYNLEALKLRKQSKDKTGIATSLNNIGNLYIVRNIFDTALIYYQQALEMRKEIGFKQSIAGSYVNISAVYEGEKKYEPALQNANMALDVATQAGAIEQMIEAEEQISNISLKMGKGMDALQHYKKMVVLKDSMFNKENTKKEVQSEMNYDFEKKQAAEKADQDKRDALQDEQARKQRLVIYFFSGILLLVIGFAIFAYRSYLQKQKANLELDEKNHKIEGAYTIIEDKNREITDSINYAKRIQSAMLPSKEEIQKAFPSSFVLFKPKDIVSGDFYFHTLVPSGEGAKSMIAVADCTGHGVPGAFMSLIGNEKLKDAVEYSSDAGEILSQLNKGIKTSLRQSVDSGSTRDGMDIALASLSPSEGGSMKVGYSGANRPLWIVRNGKAEVEEIKATKWAIGGFTEESQKFQSHEVKLNKGDTMYMFSDGYADQFGGPDGKKLTTRKFRELLLSLVSKPMPEQESELSTFIENWQGSREQLDDILVIGIRV